MGADQSQKWRRRRGAAWTAFLLALYCVGMVVMPGNWKFGSSLFERIATQLSLALPVLLLAFWFFSRPR